MYAYHGYIFICVYRVSDMFLTALGGGVVCSGRSAVHCIVDRVLSVCLFFS